MVENQEHLSHSIIKVKIPIREEVNEDHSNEDDDDEDIFGFEDEDHEGQIQKIKNNNISRICRVCNKGFSSGKALGGHMRIHVQASANKDFISGKKRKRLLNQQVDIFNKKNNKGINNQPPPTCSLCGKKFPTMKSLFGHMRCHPDRNWRGIRPPAKNYNTSNSSSSSNDDLSKVVGGVGWSVTAKRSRSKPTFQKSSSFEEEQLHDDDDAVHFLMLLAYGDSFNSGLTGNNHKQENPAYKIENEDANLVSSRRIIEETQFPAESSVKKDYLDIDEGSNGKSDRKGAMIVKMKRIKRRKRKKMRLKDLGSLQEANSSPFPHQIPSQVKPENDYRCSVGTNINVPMKEESTEEAAASNSKLLLARTNEYKSVHKILSNAIDDQPQLLSSQVSFLGEVRNTSGPSILDFDLNELPVPEDEAADNHGCVSYNSLF